jgi:hypothetical protein
MWRHFLGRKHPTRTFRRKQVSHRVDDTLEGPLGALSIGEKSSTAFPDRKLPLMEYSLIGDEPQGPTGRVC